MRSAQNKLKKGTNPRGETSEYSYNALGARIQNVQTRGNANMGYMNVLLNNGSRFMKDYMAALSDGRNTWQPTWETEVGTTVQNATEKVTINYVVDYLSVANRDIMVYEEGSFTQRNMYDHNSKRISVELTYAAETQLGEPGENIASDKAVALNKVWYRTSHLDSTLFAVNKDGAVVYHSVYDAWGNPQTDTKTDLNYTGLDNRNNYTGYTWDETLGLYFAQNRFYDAENHRFTQEDPFAGYLNEPMSLVKYLYVRNNPLTRTDPLGLLTEGDLIKRNQSNSAADVRTLQNKLNELQNAFAIPTDGKSDMDDIASIKSTKLNVTGEYDAATEEAVNRFKDAVMPGGNQHPNRGVVGITTWKYLGLSYYPVDERRVVNSSKIPVPPGAALELPDFEDMSLDAIGAFLIDVMNSAPITLFAWEPQQGIWYSTLEAPQRAFGYNDSFNAAFTAGSLLGVSYRSFISLFTAIGYSWRVEGWKGNYLQMGVGTEIGIYAETTSEHTCRTESTPEGSSNDEFTKFACKTVRHYPVAPDSLWPKVSISLYADNKLVFSRPEQNHWWLNGFSPSTKKTNPNDIRVEVTIDFGNEKVAKAFHDNVIAGAKGDGEFKVTKDLGFTWHDAQTGKVSFTWA